MKTFVALASFVAAAVAQSAVWGQCGGIGWTGPTTCVSGAVCTVQNAYYSQCLPSSAGSTTTSAGGGTTTAPGNALPTSTSTVASLHALAKAQGKLYFGSATDNPELSNTAYTKILFSDMFGQITPGNSMKWGPTEPSRGTFSYAQGDVVLNDAKNASQIVRAHNLAWYEQLPNWLSSGNFDNATLQTILTEHVTSAATHYKGQVYAWDVVNEPVDDSGNMRSWLYQDKVGTGYIDLAFRTAHAADPNAKLYLNDYNLEYSGAKFTTTLNLVKQLVAQGTPIHGVGFEGHMIVGSVPSASSIASQMKQFTDLGLEVAITELDIRMTLPETAAQRMQQKTDYQNMVQGCLLTPKCVGVTVWDFTDLYSWVPSTFSGQGAACPWDSNFGKKPAYDGIVAGLGGSS
ncbi:endo-1,4-beta-xylanase precursor [Auricularia subglabra TFB-10046 SS5]|nr:endo-1,4-beta-xylanase precursor [Auricularia subglabra TFB-10046 SS5]